MGISYPFRVRTTSRTKAVVIKANNYKNALNKILSLNPGKRVLTKYARNMDLISAQVEAAMLSKQQKRKIYIVVEPDGECEVVTDPKKKEVVAVYLNGSEIKAEPETVKVETKKQTNKMSTPEVKSPVKKAATPAKKTVAAKTAAKKVAPVKKSAPVKKEAAAPVKLGKDQKLMAIKAVIAAIAKGNKAFNAAGKPLPASYLSKMTDPAKEIVVSLVAAA